MTPAAATVDAAWIGGVRYFDTAPHYGLGLSEQRPDRALAGWPRGQLTVSTTVGRTLATNPSPTGSGRPGPPGDLPYRTG